MPNENKIGKNEINKAIINLKNETNEDVPEKLMEYMKKLVNTGINELCIGDKMFVDSDSSSSDDNSPCWY